jgi:hypothetical protein
MANTLLEDIGLFLVANNIATGDGIDIFRDFTPEQPDSLIALHEYNGDSASFYDSSVHRSIQVLSRDLNADAARQKTLDIFTAIPAAQSAIGIVHFTSERWGQVFLRQPPFKLKVDENNRVYYAFNIGITTTIE